LPEIRYAHCSHRPLYHFQRAKSISAAAGGPCAELLNSTFGTTGRIARAAQGIMTGGELITSIAINNAN